MVDMQHERAASDSVDQSVVADITAPGAADEQVQEMLAHTIDVGALAGAVSLQDPADAADTLEDLSEREATELIEEMEDQAAADALAEMRVPLAVSVLEGLVEDDPVYAGRLIELMAPDDATDLLQELEPHQQSRLLAHLQAEPAESIGALIGYDSESAAGMMTTDYLAVKRTLTVGEAIEYIRGEDVEESVNDALVIDDDERLVGLVPLRRLLLADNNEHIDAIMDTSVEAVRADLDREHVAQTFDRYDYAILPVVSADDRLLGVVTVDDVIDIIRMEQTEDVQRGVGAGKGEAVYSRVRDKIRGRIGWLGTSLVMMSFAACVILFSEDVIRERPLLAFLLPVIAAVVGNGGQQAMMVTLRGLVLDEVRGDGLMRLLLREVLVGVFNGFVLACILVIGVGVIGMAGVESASMDVGLIAGLAMLIAMSAATLTGTGVPLLMRRFGIDPALASSIILIMITDGVAFITLISLTRLVL
ncbi:MAG: magnesium transporter [Phycisphaerales bacterium]